MSTFLMAWARFLGGPNYVNDSSSTKTLESSQPMLVPWVVFTEKFSVDPQSDEKGVKIEQHPKINQSPTLQYHFIISSRCSCTHLTTDPCEVCKQDPPT